MCAINGIISFSETDERVLKGRLQKMLELTVHRGPDSSASVCATNAALGVNRLSIVSPKDNNVIPRTKDDDSGLSLLFNGEIVNYRALQKDVGVHSELGDTATLLPLYLKYGRSFVHKLAGMFAVALYDSRARRLDLWRDPLGIKPLYYSQVEGQVIFSSEIKAIYQALGDKPRIDFSSLDHILRVRFHPGSTTGFPGIQRVLPGQHISFTEGKTVSEFYWDVAKFIPRPQDEITKTDEVNGQFKDLLDTVLSEHLQADVDGGFFVSGGVDSSLLFSLSTRQESSYKTGLTLSFEPEVEDEKYLKSLETHLKRDVQKVSVTSDTARQALEKLIWYQDEPLENPIHVGTFLMAERARQLGIKSVVTGDGSDEFFLGYERHDPWFKKNEDPSSDWLKWLWTLLPSEIQELYTPDALQLATPMLNFAGADILKTKTFEEAILFEQKDRLPEYHCMRLDRMTMAWGVEARVPFLDHRIVEFVQRLPFAFRYGDSGKGWLKEIAQPYLPADIVRRPKTHFPSLPDLWLKGKGAEWASAILLDPGAKTRHYFRKETLERYIREHQDGTTLRGRKLWACIALELWLNNDWM